MLLLSTNIGSKHALEDQVEATCFNHFIVLSFHVMIIHYDSKALQIRALVTVYKELLCIYGALVLHILNVYLFGNKCKFNSQPSRHIELSFTAKKSYDETVKCLTKRDSVYKLFLQ